MALNLDKNLKVYHNIGEVAKMFDVSEVDVPFRNIETVRIIHNLVKVRGFKISSAKKILAHNPKGTDKKVEVLDKLMGIRSELQALKKQLDYLQ